MARRTSGDSIVFNVSLEGSILCLKDSDCGSLEYCCPDGKNGSQCCERSASVRALWIMGVFLFIAIILCLAILIRSRTKYLRCNLFGNRDTDDATPTPTVNWTPVLTTLRELPPPYSSKPLSATELLSLQRQAFRYRAAAQQTLAPVTESLLAEFNQRQRPHDHDQQQHTLPCYHDIAQPIIEEDEPGILQRSSPAPSFDEDEPIYQSDSPSDDSEGELSRQAKLKNSFSCANMSLHGSRRKLEHRYASKLLSRSHDDFSYQFASKSYTAGEPTAAAATGCGQAPYVCRAQSTSPDDLQCYSASSGMPTSDMATNSQVMTSSGLQPPTVPRPPRRNRSWSSSAAVASASHPSAMCPSSRVDFERTDYPARPHTSMACLTALPDYSPLHGHRNTEADDMV